MGKVLYILNYLGNGGTEKYTLDLIEALGNDKCVLVYSQEGPFLERFHKLNIPIYQVDMNSPFDIKAARKIKDIVEKENVECIHAQFLRENYIGLWTKLLGAKVKVIWTYHVNVPMSPPIRFLNKIFTRQNHKVITVANFMKQQLLEKGLSDKKVQVIYNGIKQPVLPPKQNIPHTDKTLAVVGRLSEEKGHRFLFQGLAKLKNENPHLKWKCNIIGDGPLHDELLQLAKELGILEQLKFKGFINDVSAEYAEADIIVLPSQNEAFPYVAIEALAFGKGVISSNVGGLPEIVRDKITGLNVNYGDVNALSNSLKLFLEDEELLKKLSNNGQEFYRENLTFDTMLQKTFNVYDISH